jgi:hypothetical protein
MDSISSAGWRGPYRRKTGRREKAPGDGSESQSSSVLTLTELSISMETEQARLASNPVGKGNTTMLQQRVIRKAINLGVVGLFGLGLLAVDSAPPSPATAAAIVR